MGLPSHVDHERAKQLLRKDTWGGVLSFGVIGGPDAGAKVVDMMKLATNMANVGMFACFTDAGRRVVHDLVIGDAKTIITNPATTTHQQLTDAEQASAGVTPDLIRVG